MYNHCKRFTLLLIFVSASALQCCCLCNMCGQLALSAVRGQRAAPNCNVNSLCTSESSVFAPLHGHWGMLLCWNIQPSCSVSCAVYFRPSRDPSQPIQGQQSSGCCSILRSSQSWSHLQHRFPGFWTSRPGTCKLEAMPGTWKLYAG